MFKKAVFFLLVFSFTSSLLASEKENVIRAVVLERITQFITYTDLSQEFNICVYKDKTLFKSFKNLYKGRTYKELPIKVLNISKVDALDRCNVTYVSNVNKSRKKKIVKKSKKQTLLISENTDDGRWWSWWT